MTFTKPSKVGQAVFEYFVLTVITVGLFLVFMKNQNFLGIRNAAEEFFAKKVSVILP
jgi:hypothetical protein